MNTLTRRSALAALAVVANTVPALAAGEDAELIALVREFNRIADKINEQFRRDARDMPVDDKLLDELYAALHPLERQIIGMPAQTLAGISAKAVVCFWCQCGEIGDNPEATTSERVVASILTDLMRLRGVAPMTDHEFVANYSAAKCLPDLV